MLGHIFHYILNKGKTSGIPSTLQEYVIGPDLYIPEIPAELGLLIEGITQYEPADRILLDQIIEKLQDFLSIDDS